jgi:dissimilatory sulfite reductase related protein
VPQVDIAGRTVLVDEEGFLPQPDIGNDDVAALSAASDGVEQLTPDHWAVVRCIRSCWERSGRAPMVRLPCKETGINLRAICKLFPAGPAKGACKYAGLPKPDGCV